MSYSNSGRSSLDSVGRRGNVTYNRVHTDDRSAVRRVPTVIRGFVCTSMEREVTIFGLTLSHIDIGHRPHIVLGGRGWGARWVETFGRNSSPCFLCISFRLSDAWRFPSVSSGNNFRPRGEFKEKKNTVFFRRTLFFTFVRVAGKCGAGTAPPTPVFCLPLVCVSSSSVLALRPCLTGLHWPATHSVSSSVSWVPGAEHESLHLAMAVTFWGDCRVSWCTECPFFSQRMLSVLSLSSILAEYMSCSVGEAGCTHQDLEFLSSRFLQWLLSQIFFMWVFIWCLFFYLVNTHTKHKVNQRWIEVVWKKMFVVGHMVNTFNPSFGEPEVGGSLLVWGQPGLNIELLAIQDYIVRPCLRTHAHACTRTRTFVYAGYRPCVTLFSKQHNMMGISVQFTFSRNNA